MNHFHFLLYGINFFQNEMSSTEVLKDQGENVKGKNFTLCLKKRHSTTEVFNDIMKTDGWQGLFRGNLVNVIQGHRGTDPNWVPFNFRAMFQCFTMVFLWCLIDSLVCILLCSFFGLLSLIQTLILTLVGQVAYTFCNYVSFLFMPCSHELQDQVRHICLGQLFYILVFFFNSSLI